MDESRGEGEFGKVTSELKFFGLTGLQSRVYVALLKHGPSRANSLAQILKVSRVEIYSALNQLSKNGIVEIELSNPRIFRAIRAEDAISTLLALSEQHEKELRERAPLLLDELCEIEKEISRGTQDVSSHSLIVLKSGKQVKQYWRQLISSAKREIICTMSDDGLAATFRERFDDLYSECHKRGVSIMMLADVTRRNAFEAEEMGKFVDLYYSAELNRSHLFSVFDRSLAMIDVTSPTKEFQVLLTDTPLLVRGLLFQFEILRSSSIPLEERLAALLNSEDTTVFNT